MKTRKLSSARVCSSRRPSSPQWSIWVPSGPVDLADKTAGTIWAPLAHDRTCQPNFVGQPALPRPTRK